VRTLEGENENSEKMTSSASASVVISNQHALSQSGDGFADLFVDPIANGRLSYSLRSINI
jgi:hypothetical protein